MVHHFYPHSVPSVKRVATIIRNLTTIIRNLKSHHVIIGNLTTTQLSNSNSLTNNNTDSSRSQYQ